MQFIAVLSQKLARRFAAAVFLVPCVLLHAWAFPMQSKNSAPKSQKIPKVQKEDARRQIDRLEDKYREAVLKNDPAAIDSLLADDYVGIMANGTLQTKDQTLASMRTGQWHITSLDFSERKVRFYGRTALVTSLAQIEGMTPEGNVTGTYRYTRVYARDARGNWKVVNFEASRIGHHRSGSPGSSATPESSGTPTRAE